MLALRSIVHPTDFSEGSADAFAHALRIALTAKCRLKLLHVATGNDARDWMDFPQVRTALVNWGMLDEGEPQASVADRLGLRIEMIELTPQSAVAGIQKHLDRHPASLIVLNTEGREGASRWLHGSVAEAVTRHAHTPALFVPNGARGFVDQPRGEVHLKRVLIPVDHDPKPAAAVGSIMGFAHLMAGVDVEERLLHVGRTPPQIRFRAGRRLPVPVALRGGNPVESIIEAAQDWQPDLIGMPTAGHRGFLDALRGSTTERVIRQAPCPVLAVPAEP